jgi:hypothetical protein
MRANTTFPVLYRFARTTHTQPCGVYHLYLVNDQGEWPAGAAAPELNTMGAPTHTNLHLHGLFISGLAPGDDSFASIEPGDTAQCESQMQNLTNSVQLLHVSTSEVYMLHVFVGSRVGLPTLASAELTVWD